MIFFNLETRFFSPSVIKELIPFNVTDIDKGFVVEMLETKMLICSIEGAGESGQPVMEKGVPVQLTQTRVRIPKFKL